VVLLRPHHPRIRPGYLERAGAREFAAGAAGDRRAARGDALNAALHLFDEATQVTAGDSRWQGRTSDDYWAFVGPFGGATAATLLRALIDHPQRAGDPLALTVNYCAPIAEGAFDIDVRLVKANRSTQHWWVELTQGGADVATLATAVFAERRPSWSHQPAEFPQSPAFEQILPYPKVAAPWMKQYDFRFVDGNPDFSGTKPLPASAYSRLWIGDRVPRKIDALSLMSMSDAFFGRVFHARRELVPFGTVSLTTYFHTDAADLAAEDITRVLAVADAKIFHKSYGDQNGELWSPGGRLLATTTQIAYFKA
jgi:acyl-CoA thioesterase